VKGFILESLTPKGERCIHYYFKNLPYKKDKLLKHPLQIRFLFTKEQEIQNIKQKDLAFISKMLHISHRVVVDKDYKLTGIN